MQGARASYEKLVASREARFGNENYGAVESLCERNERNAISLLRMSSLVPRRCTPTVDSAQRVLERVTCLDEGIVADVTQALILLLRALPEDAGLSTHSDTVLSEVLCKSIKEWHSFTCRSAQKQLEGSCGSSGVGHAMRCCRHTCTDFVGSVSHRSDGCQELCKVAAHALPRA